MSTDAIPSAPPAAILFQQQQQQQIQERKWINRKEGIKGASFLDIRQNVRNVAKACFALSACFAGITAKAAISFTATPIVVLSTVAVLGISTLILFGIAIHNHRKTDFPKDISFINEECRKRWDSVVPNPTYSQVVLAFGPYFKYVSADDLSYLLRNDIAKGYAYYVSRNPITSIKQLNQASKDALIATLTEKMCLRDLESVPFADLGVMKERYLKEVVTNEIASLKAGYLNFKAFKDRNPDYAAHTTTDQLQEIFDCFLVFVRESAKNYKVLEKEYAYECQKFELTPAIVFPYLVEHQEKEIGDDNFDIKQFIEANGEDYVKHFIEQRPNLKPRLKEALLKLSSHALRKNYKAYLGYLNISEKDILESEIKKLISSDRKDAYFLFKELNPGILQYLTEGWSKQQAEEVEGEQPGAAVHSSYDQVKAAFLKYLRQHLKEGISKVKEYFHDDIAVFNIDDKQLNDIFIQALKDGLWKEGIAPYNTIIVRNGEAFIQEAIKDADCKTLLKEHYLKKPKLKDQATWDMLNVTQDDLVDALVRDSKILTYSQFIHRYPDVKEFNIPDAKFQEIKDKFFNEIANERYIQEDKYDWVWLGFELKHVLQERWKNKKVRDIYIEDREIFLRELRDPFYGWRNRIDAEIADLASLKDVLVAYPREVLNDVLDINCVNLRAKIVQHYLNSLKGIYTNGVSFEPELQNYNLVLAGSNEACSQARAKYQQLVKEAEAEMNGFLAANRMQVQQLLAQLEAVERDIESIDAGNKIRVFLPAIKKEVATHERTLKEAEALLAKSKGAQDLLTQLEAQRAARQSELAVREEANKKDIARFESEKEELLKQKAAQPPQQVSGVMAAVAALRAKDPVAEIQTKIDALKASLKPLYAAIDQISSQIKEAQGDLSALHRRELDVEACKRTLANYSRDIHSIETSDAFVKYNQLNAQKLALSTLKNELASGTKQQQQMQEVEARLNEKIKGQVEAPLRAFLESCR